MNKIATAKVILKLGITNVIRIAVYRLLLKLNLHKVQKLSSIPVEGAFFRTPEDIQEDTEYVPHDWKSGLRYFSYHLEKTAKDNIPLWHRNYLTGAISDKTDIDWWNIGDFDKEVGDIKVIWELSRMDWVLGFSQAAKTGDNESLSTLNNWLTNWCDENPAYKGINWKCGQEASIRVMHLAAAALILNQVKSPEPALMRLVSMHLKRIAPTMSYAIAQNNNHGTSEAAALFIGGSWLKSLGEADGDTWQQTGRKWLEDRAEVLIGRDGSFSQYSVNYHRLMLDTFSLAELWRQELSLNPFSSNLIDKLNRATNWLYQFTRAGNGDVPNIGANDGALLLPWGNSDYRDFRPAVQLASVLFSSSVAYSGEGSWNAPLYWFNLPVPTQKLSAQLSSQFDDGGYFLLKRKDATAVLRYPRFKFRPGQADALHLDFWFGTENYLRDAGTFSYNENTQLMAHFSDVQGHNTIQFDDRNQMPRLGRFLLGDWLKTDSITSIQSHELYERCAAGYTDSHGAQHRREISLHDDLLQVIDKVSGFKQKAVLRWRLMPGDWIVEENTVSSEHFQIIVESDAQISRLELVTGYESRYYLQKTELPVLEIEVNEPATIKTLCRY